MVRWLQAGEGHAGDEAAPEVRAEVVRRRGVADQQDHHDEEEPLVGGGDLGVLVLVRDGRQELLGDEPGPELDGEDHGDAHEGDTNDRVDHDRHELEVAAQAEEHVEQHEGQDVVDEGRCDDSLAEVLLQHAGLAKEAQGDADAGRCKGSADGDGIGEERLSVEHGEGCASDQRQNGTEHSHDAGLGADNQGLAEVEVHAALEDHHSHARVPDEREEVRRERAVIRHIMLALLDEALTVGVVAATAGEAAALQTAVASALGSVVERVRIAMRLVVLDSAVAVGAVIIAMGIVQVVLTVAEVHVGNLGKRLAQG
mmetsp:Transcript_4126/g.10627  ORF Transcript_4126/g.10627 Transcript_4126/m.10627 type:complete len:313 (-) Transcript_4126:323-1261(-)